MQATESERPTQIDSDYERLTKAAHADDAREIAAVRPPAPPPAPPADPKAMAKNIREMGPAAALYATMSSFYGGKLELTAYKELIDGVLRDLGDPKNPMERMLAEQMIISHHAIGRLQARAATQEKAESVEVYLRGTTKLMGEFRKHLELFTKLRAQPSADPQAPVKPESQDGAPPIRDTELGGNRHAHAA